MDGAVAKAATLHASSGLPTTSRQIISPSAPVATMIAQTSRAFVGMLGQAAQHGSSGRTRTTGGHAGGGLFGLGEDHASGDGLQDARDRDINCVAHV